MWKRPPLPSTFRVVLFSITVNHGNALFLFFRSQMDFVLVWCGAERFCNAAVFYASPRVNSVVKVTIAAIKQSSRSSVHRTYYCSLLQLLFYVVIAVILMEPFLFHSLSFTGLFQHESRTFWFDRGHIILISFYLMYCLFISDVFLLSGSLYGL